MAKPTAIFGLFNGPVDMFESNTFEQEPSCFWRKHIQVDFEPISVASVFRVMRDSL